jgi:hypothetical protein
MGDPRSGAPARAAWTAYCPLCVIVVVTSYRPSDLTPTRVAHRAAAAGGRAHMTEGRGTRRGRGVVRRGRGVGAGQARREKAGAAGGCVGAQWSEPWRDAARLERKGSRQRRRAPVDECHARFAPPHDAQHELVAACGG